VTHRNEMTSCITNCSINSLAVWIWCN